MTWDHAFAIAEVHARKGNRCKLFKENGFWYVELN